MKKIYHIVMLCLSVSLSMTSCTDEFESINHNNNALETAETSSLFNSGVNGTLMFFGGRTNNDLMNYPHYFNVGGGSLQTYAMPLAGVEQYDRDVYEKCVKPFYQIILATAGDEAKINEWAIATIMHAYVYSQHTALFGGIPMTYASTGDEYIPYDTEEEIYTSLITSLQQSAEALDATKVSLPEASDRLYGGDVQQWRKFANSLRLRLILRISDCAEGELLANIQNQAQELMQSNLSETLVIDEADNASMHFENISGGWNYIYEKMVFKGATLIDTQKIVPSEAMLTRMQPYGDPRLPIFFKPVEDSNGNPIYVTPEYETEDEDGNIVIIQGEPEVIYLGKPLATSWPQFIDSNGEQSKYAGLQYKDYSHLPDRWLDPEMEFILLSNSDVYFNLAELALKGWGNQNDAFAQNCYEQGIRTNMAHYDITGVSVDDYLSQEGISWGVPVRQATYEAYKELYDNWYHASSSAIMESNTTNIKQRQIVLQHWIAMTPRSIDGWTLIRRTQVLELLPHTQPSADAIVTAANWAMIPSRLEYSPRAYQTNSVALQEYLQSTGFEDTMNQGLWFTQPYKTTFTGYPEGLPTTLN